MKRREELRERFGSHRANGYADAVKNIRAKISFCKRQIKRIDARNEKIKSILYSVNKFFGVDIKSNVSNKIHSLARNCYYKYGMEHGIEGSKLSAFIGRSKLSAHKQRTRFTRSFKTNPENKKQYHNFLNSIKP